MRESKADIVETLARLAAQFAGHDPDKHLRIQIGNVVVHDDVTWRYPDFLNRAESAYQVLADSNPPPAGE